MSMFEIASYDIILKLISRMKQKLKKTSVS